jgi:glycosyl transferase family 25
MDKNIKVFVITLEGSVDRQTNIASQLNKLGIAFEFIFGIDGRELTNEQIQILFDKEKNRRYYRRLNLKERGMSACEIGCALSHRLAYEEIIKRNIDHAIILEDDSFLKDDIQLVIEHLSQLKANNYLIKIDVEPGIKIVPWHKIRLDDNLGIAHTSSSLCSTMGYYIDNQAAKTMCRLTKRIFCVADDYDYFRRFIKLRLLDKTLVFENPRVLHSIIGNRNEINNLEKCNDIFSAIYQLIIRSIPMKIYRYIITLFH